MQAHESSGMTTSQERGRHARPDSLCRSCIPLFFPRSCLHSEGDAELLDTSLAASGEVLRITLDDTNKGGETARTGSVLLSRHPDVRFLSFHLTHFQTRFRLLLLHHPHAEILLSEQNGGRTLQSVEQYNYIKLSVSNARARFIPQFSQVLPPLPDTPRGISKTPTVDVLATASLLRAFKPRSSDSFHSVYSGLRPIYATQSHPKMLTLAHIQSLSGAKLRSGSESPNARSCL